MTFGKTALRCWLPAAALLLALLCPLPVWAARAGTAIPVTVRTDGAAADAVYRVELTPLDAAPAPAQSVLTVKSGGTVYFTGFAFDEPGDYRYLVAERGGGTAHMTYDAHSYTVTVRVTGRPDGGLAAGLWAVRSGETAKADSVLFVNRYDPPTAATTRTPAATVTTVAAGTGTRTVKAAAPAALPQTGDGFPVEALAAAVCASVIGFGTAWKRR
ncbi:Spy0128 family protein [uncultured Gemmiger sp.]|uniref:Spy0128 family protein n=1 Tax=uncultured Gemmiger sp. TaxID=1623490 RepID=UPI00259430E6|nr:FctA domain-containing protein [uncultured Gemmiger sp.]